MRLEETHVLRVLYMRFKRMYRNVHQLKFTKTMTRKGFKYLEIKYKMNLGEELKIIWKHPLHAL